MFRLFLLIPLFLISCESTDTPTPAATTQPSNHPSDIPPSGPSDRGTEKNPIVPGTRDTGLLRYDTDLSNGPYVR